VPGNTKNSLLFVEQFYYPDGWGGAQIPRDITTALALRGWRVDVVCGSEPYAPVVGEAQSDPRDSGVRIRRVPRLLPGDIHRFKLLRQCWYYLACVPLILFTRARIYVAQTNPPMILPIVAFISWLRRRPLVVIAQDLYPEVVFAHGMMNPAGFAGRMLRALFRWSYRRARKVVCLGPCMREKLVDKGVPADRIVEISNWATGAESIVRGTENLLRQQWGLAGKFVLLYSGNLGIAHDIETPIKAVARARHEIENLVLVFVGKGSRIEEAKRMVAQLGLDAVVHFKPLVPAELLPHSLGVADLALVTLRKSFEGLVVPSKLLGHLARGVPTLFVGPPSDVEHFLRESKGGISVPNDDVQGLASILVEMASSGDALAGMGMAGQSYYNDHLAKSVGLSHYEALLRDV
jgi:glycosyltransferase involved in cell wall biosynthesis